MNTRFSSRISGILMVSVLFAACKKTMDSPVNYTKLKVLDYGSNTPLANVSVKLYQCKSQGFGGCTQNSLVGTATTDNDGSFQFDSKLAPYLIIASYNKYWDGSTGGISTGLGNIYLVPLAYTKVQLRKINAHPDGLFLTISLSDSRAFFPGLAHSYNQPADSTVTIGSYGNSDNIISWYFTDLNGLAVPSEQGGQLPPYHINHLSSTVGSEAWNSRDLKSRPH